MIEPIKYVVLVLLLGDGSSRLTPMRARDCVSIAASVKAGNISRAVSTDGRDWRQVRSATCSPQSALTAVDRRIFGGQ